MRDIEPNPEAEWELIKSLDEVAVKLSVEDVQPYIGEETWAVFKRLSWGDYALMEPSITHVTHGEDDRDVRVYVDHYALRELIVKRCLKEWNIPIELEFDNRTGWLTSDCYNEIASLPAPIMGRIMQKYEKTVLSDDDEEKLDRQAASLFNTKGGGVSNPLESVTLFCVLGNFWDKFGLNRYDLERLPYREYAQLRMMMGYEGEYRRREQRSGMDTHPVHVAGAGGRTRQSRGKRIREF
jgi:hypothetical protein